jgi:hypothetical protein
MTTKYLMNANFHKKEKENEYVILTNKKQK